MPYTLLANLIVVAHLAYVLFVVLGLVAILIGAARGWGWVRNLWFRLIHLAAIGVVAFQSIFGLWCPLTVWEYNLRVRAGQDPEHVGFVARIVQAVLFPEWPPWAFNVLHIGFAIIVLATLFFVPPSLNSHRRGAESAEDPGWNR